MLRTTPASGFTEGAQNSWKEESSTASTVGCGVARSASRMGRPMLPHAALGRPADDRIDASIDVVVVFPLVPVTTNHFAGGP